MVSYFALKLFCGFLLKHKFLYLRTGGKMGEKYGKRFYIFLPVFCGTKGVREGRADIVKFISQYNNDGYKIYL